MNRERKGYAICVYSVHTGKINQGEASASKPKPTQALTLNEACTGSPPESQNHLARGTSLLALVACRELPFQLHLVSFSPYGTSLYLYMKHREKLWKRHESFRPGDA